MADYLIDFATQLSLRASRKSKLAECGVGFAGSLCAVVRAAGSQAVIKDDYFFVVVQNCFR